MCICLDLNKKKRVIKINYFSFSLFRINLNICFLTCCIFKIISFYYDKICEKVCDKTKIL